MDTIKIGGYGDTRQHEYVGGDVDVCADVLEDIPRDAKVPRWHGIPLSPRVNV